MTVVRLAIGEGGLVKLELDVAAVIVIAIVMVLVILLANGWRKAGFPEFEAEGAELGYGKQKIKFKVNNEELQVAFSLWTELSTRKLGIPIDETYDTITEVYDSWYQCFGVMRDLIKQIPATKMKRSKETAELVGIAVAILNSGMRPHLTKWQARYRKWWAIASSDESNSGRTPQEIQRQFPDYEQLMSELKAVNQKFVYFQRRLQATVLPPPN